MKNKNRFYAVIGLALAIFVILSGCGSKTFDGIVPDADARKTDPSKSDSSAQIADDKGSSAGVSGNEDGKNGSKFSAEDQKFIDENGYLTHHSQVDSDELSWKYDDTTCTLYISGSGPMKDYLSDYPEWDKYSETIEHIVLSNGITTVGDYAFYDYMSLTSVELPDTVEYIGMGAFAYGDLEDIPFPAALKEIAFDAFMEVKVHKPLNIPDGVEIIASGAFHANDFWDTITIPASVYYIEEKAFSNSLHVHDFIVDPANEYYTSIDGVLYDKDVTVLLEYPLFKETRDFVIPDTVTRIADYSFDLNFFMQTLSIPKSVNEVGGDQFGLLRQLKEYKVEDGNELFRTDGGALLSKDGKTLYAYAPLNEAEEYTIPDGVENIEFRAAAETWYLKKLYLPEGIKTVGVQAFSDMNGTEIYIPESFTDTVIMIDNYAFFSAADGYAWDLGSGFTYTPNTYNGVENNGSVTPAAMTIHYAGSAEKWADFVSENDIDLYDTVVICEK